MIKIIVRPVEAGREKIRMSSNLLEQWNEHIIRGNQLSRELEDFEGIMLVADMPECKVAIFDGTGTSFIDRVLSPEKMADIKRIVITSLNEAKLTKEVELEKLMGVRKPAFINPEFEAAVQEMERASKPETVLAPEPDPVEEKLTDILKQEYKRIEDKPVESAPSLNKYPAKKDKRIKTPENMTEADISRMYVNEGKDRKQIAEFYGVSEGKINNFLYLHDIKRKKATKPNKQPAEKERP